MKTFYKYVMFPLLFLIIFVLLSVGTTLYANSSTKKNNIEMALTDASAKTNAVYNASLVIIDRGALNIKLYEDKPNELNSLFQTCTDYIVENTNYLNYIALYNANGELVLEKNQTGLDLTKNISQSDLTKSYKDLLDNNDTIDYVMSRVYEEHNNRFFYIMYKANISGEKYYYLMTINVKNFLDSLSFYSSTDETYSFELLFSDGYSDFVVDSNVKNYNNESVMYSYKNKQNVGFSLRIYSSKNFRNQFVTMLVGIVTFLLTIVLESGAVGATIYINKIKRLKIEGSTDKLTSLGNENLLRNYIKMLEKNEIAYCLFYMDLNNFKIINDTYGHDYGDEILVEVSKKLKDYFKGSVLVVRLHGDEFCFVVKDIISSDAANLLRDKLFDYSNKEYVFSGHNIKSSFAIGYALVPSEASTLDEALNIADKRMYEHKRNVKKYL